MKKDKITGIITKIVFAIIVIVAWEIVAKAHIFGSTPEQSELVFPPLEIIGQAFINNFTKGFAGISLWIYTLNSMLLLLQGLGIGIALAFILSGLSMISKIFYNIYNLVVSVMDLLPGIALLPVVIIIVGVKPEVIVFLVVHAVLWPMSRNVLDGFLAVPQMYIESGKNMGLKGFGLLARVYVPGATTYIVSGLKVGWARAWRGLISAEMIFGVASMPGIGLYINQMRSNMNNAEMYATLIVIVIIGLIVQYGILAPIEKNTVKKWGMVR